MSDHNRNGVSRRLDASLLLFVGKSPQVSAGQARDQAILTAAGETRAARLGDLAALAHAALVQNVAGRLCLTPRGLDIVRQLQARPGLELETLTEHGEAAPVLVNRHESPLSSLAGRNAKDGKAFLSEAEFNAGERIRADFTRAMLMPRTSANWQAAVSGGRRGSSENGVLNLTDSALSARQRVENAMDGMGPDLSGVVTDICCFLKGFEQLEAERGLPKRSGKFLLKAGLGLLARHYWPPAPAGRKSHHWGAPGYRPEIGNPGQP